jgi:prepilin-type N-terminal cleavage/methylation domain-containing protein
MEQSRCPRAFTLIELLVVIAILALLISIVLPSMSRARQLARRAGCTANLHAMGRGVHLYANQNQTLLPSYLDLAGSGTMTFVGRVRTEATHNLTNPALSVTRAWYLLVREGLVDIKAFRCPEDRSISGEYPHAGGGYSIRGDWDFPAAEGDPPLSYSLLPTVKRTSTDHEYSLTDNGNLIIASDANPLTRWNPALVDGARLTELVSGADPGSNSPNHRGDGQVVLALDGHASWENAPLCGIDITYGTAPDTSSYPDNIWTVADSGDPVHGDPSISDRPAIIATDTVLLP